MLQQRDVKSNNDNYNDLLSHSAADPRIQLIGGRIFERTVSGDIQPLDYSCNYPPIPSLIRTLKYLRSLLFAVIPGGFTVFL